jgi:hypothetical protein
MADEVDVANEQVQNAFDRKLAEILSRPMPEGTQGDCDLCGEWSSRLVDGACAPCRDKYKLP